MVILSIETTGAEASVALINGVQAVRRIGDPEKMNHLRHLIPLVRQLLEAENLSLDQLTHIAVSEGPGSFTGIRIGMATAKTMAQTLSIPMISVPTLKSFAYVNKQPGILICPMFDARRGQIYSGAYYWSEQGRMEVLMEDDAWDAETFFENLARRTASLNDSLKKILFLGDGIVKYEEKILSMETNLKIEFAEEKNRFQDASLIALMAQDLLKDGVVTTFQEIQPVYLRKAEAERKLEAQLAAERKM